MPCEADCLHTYVGTYLQRTPPEHSYCCVFTACLHWRIPHGAHHVNRYHCELEFLEAAICNLADNMLNPSISYRALISNCANGPCIP